MLNTLQAASRLAVRAAIAVFTAVVLLLIQSAFWSNRVSLWMQAIIFATALLSYFRPRYGLLALAILVPLAQVGSRTLDSTMRGGEALALAFLAGVLVRTWTLRGFRSFPSFPSTRLETAALIFGLVVAASCAEQIWFLQIQRDYPWPFVQNLLAYASREYITRSQGFGMIFNAMLLLEGMALVVVTARTVRLDVTYAYQLVLALVAGALGTALLTIGSVALQLASTGDARGNFVDFFVQQRWTVHVSDINAAGSFFAMAMFIATGMAWVDKRHAAIWFPAGAIFAAATWMTQSRTAFFAIVLMVVFLGAAKTIGRRLGFWPTIMLTAAGAVAVAVMLWTHLPRRVFGPGATTAFEVRWLFLGTTWRMLMSQPVFGLGVGQYFLWSFHFASPAMLKYYQRQNAHNNFAQIAGELGLVGLAAFAAVLVASTWQRKLERPATIRPALLGLSVFILTWLGGHPLLVSEVSIPFWVLLGLVAAFAATDVRFDTRAASAFLALLVLLTSVPVRVRAKASTVDFTRVSYGLSTRNVMTDRATIFVPPDGTAVEIPVRSRAASDEHPVYVDVVVDHAAIETLTLTHREWQRPHVQLPANSGLRFHEIELRIRRVAPPHAIDHDRSAVEVGKWEIISKPNG